jgi:hypothetical protein
VIPAVMCGLRRAAVATAAAAPVSRGGGGAAQAEGFLATLRGKVGDDTCVGVRRDPFGNTGPHSQEGVRRLSVF